MGGRVDMRYYNLDWSNVFLITSTETMLGIDEFSRFVIENEIENIFWSQPSEAFLKERNTKLRFPDSKIFLVFVGHVMYWSDSWGYWKVEDFLESYENRIFFAINRLKEKYADQIYWKDSVGSLYEDAKYEEYTLEEEFESSVKFFNGCIQNSKSSKVIMDHAKKKGFRMIDEMLISEEAGFVNFDDYSDGKEFRAPNKQTLESVRLLENLEYSLKFKDKTHALLFAVLLWRKEKLKEIQSNNIPPEKLDLIYSDLLMFMPRVSYTGFNRISNQEEVKRMILENSSYSLLGFYDQSNEAFQFSELKLYVDGSSILHNGQKRGYQDENKLYPDISYLEDCLRDLETISIMVTGVYIDSGTVRLLKNSNNEIWKRYQNIADKYSLTPTFTDEKADERLIHKLRDDPNCFVITNDGFDEYNLSESEKGRLIFFQRSKKGRYTFYLNNRTKINKFLGDKNLQLRKYLNIKPLRELGNWPYRDSYDSFEIQSYSNELFQKLKEKKG